MINKIPQVQLEVNYQPYYDPKTRRFVDLEWENAEKIGKRQTWWVYPNYRFEPEKRFVKSYTPALADLVRKRTGYKIEPFD